MTASSIMLVVGTRPEAIKLAPLAAALLARDRAAEVAITARHPHQAAAAEALGVTVLGEADGVTWAKDRGADVVIESVGGAAPTVQPLWLRLALAVLGIVVLGISAAALAAAGASPVLVGLTALVAVVAAVNAVVLARRIRRR